MNKSVVVCLDVMAVGPGFEIPVFLILTPDVEHDSASGFILNRLGQMRRGVYPDYLYGYGYHLADLGRSFTRTNMTISQIRTSNCGPGKMALFKLEDWKTISLVGDIDTIRIGQPIESLSTSTEPFECSGGVMPLRHECRDCQKLGGFKIAFGTQQNSRPWCRVSNRLEDTHSMSYYNEVEKLNSRFHERHNAFLQCKKRANVHVFFGGDDKSYIIRVDIEG